MRETGLKEKGGDGTAARIRGFLVEQGYGVFLDVGVLEGETSAAQQDQLSGALEDLQQR